MKKRKFSTYVIRFLLITMILLSIILMIRISVNIGSSTTQQIQAQPASDMVRDDKKLLLPTSLYHHEQEKIYDASKESSALEVMTALSQLEFYEKKHLDHLSVADLKKWQSFSNGVELNYTTPIDFHYLQSIYDLNIDRTPKIKMTDLWINFDTKEVMLLNRQEKEGYLFGLNGHWKTFLKETTAKFKHRYEVVNVSKDYIGYLPKDKVNFSVYTYMMSFQPYNNVTQALFTNPNSVTTSGDDHHIVFTGDREEEMRVNNNNGVMSIVREMDDQWRGDGLLSSLAVVSRLGNDFGELRFVENEGNNYYYYVFVEGYPIFTNYYRGQVEVSVSKQTMKLFMNQETIHVPVPETKTITLKNGKTIMKDLQKHHIHLDRIERIQLGYQWKEIKEEMQSAIQLIPTWFVHYDDEWVPLEDVLKGEG